MCCGSSDPVWVVTYPVPDDAPEGTQPRTEEFVNVISARVAANRVSGATYDRKPPE